MFDNSTAADLLRFLARRDTLPEAVDVIILCGSSIVESCNYAVELYFQKKARHLLITGGIGHSTSFLYDAVRRNSLDFIFTGSPTPLETLSESEVFEKIIKHSFPDIPIIIEKRSTNCGENAQFSVALLKQLNIIPEMQSLVVIQDPTMARRTHLSFTKALKQQQVYFSKDDYGNTLDDPIGLYSSAPFVEPEESLWGSKERMLRLILGEVPRLVDYGSPAMGGKGLGFIDDEPIPTHVVLLQEKLCAEYPMFAVR
eukprot:PhF_6_TR4273/c0_g1_i1/m.5772